MIIQARKLWPNEIFNVGSSPPPADWIVSSGIFNIMIGFTPHQWLQHFEGTLALMLHRCRKGIAFNGLTSLASPQRERLCYFDRLMLANMCYDYRYKTRLIIDDPHEFTFIYRKK